MPKIFIDDSGNLKHPKNLKSINMVSHLVCCCVIPRTATLKGREKDMFWKIRAIRNVKRNENDIT